MLRFKTDENLPSEVADLLMSAGHDALTTLDQHLQGCDDSLVAEVCCDESRVLVTLDTDFSDIRVYDPAKHSGIVVLRLARHDKPHVLSVFGRLLPMFATEALDGKLWIVDEASVRVRG
ncbi:MAG: DUF5615 family PIN-like protein [Lacipirellulaceae bacterium]